VDRVRKVAPRDFCVMAPKRVKRQYHHADSRAALNVHQSIVFSMLEEKGEREEGNIVALSLDKEKTDARGV